MTPPVVFPSSPATRTLLALALLAGVLDAAPQRTRRVPFRFPDLTIPVPDARGHDAAIGDLDADGDLEILICGSIQTWGWHHDGTPLPGFPIGCNGLLVLADLDGDPLGDLEILQGTYASGAQVSAYHHEDADGSGQADRVAGWPVVVPPPVSANSFPSVEDLDGDGSVEVAFAVELYEFSGDDARVYCFDRHGQLAPGWPKHVEDHSFRYTSAAFGDLDGDGTRELVAKAVMVPPTGQDHVHAWDLDGTAQGGFPAVHDTPSAGGIESVSSPVLGDLTGDGLVDVVTGVRGEVVAVDGSGAVLFRHVIGGRSLTPALADLDEDGDLEIVVGVQRVGIGRIMVLDHAGNRMAESVEITGGVHPTFSPLVGDLDGDGLQELLLPTYSEFNGRSARIHVFDRDCRRRLDLTMLVPPEPWSSCCARIGDLDADGDVEVVLGGAHNVYVWNFDGSPADCDWPMFQHDPHMSGRFQ